MGSLIVVGIEQICQLINESTENLINILWFWKYLTLAEKLFHLVFEGLQVLFRRQFADFLGLSWAGWNKKTGSQSNGKKQ